MNDLVLDDTNTTLIPVALATDGWSIIAADNEKTPMRGAITRYIDKDYLRGADATVITGTKVVVYGVRECNVRWQGKRPIEYQFRENADTPLPDPEEASGDPATWEKGPDGELRRPVVRTHLIYMVVPGTGEWLTFSSSTWGGRIAINELSDQISMMRQVHPRAMPIVELSSTPWTTKHGRRMRPFFKVCGWQNLSDDGATIASPPDGLPRSEAGDALNDSLPF